ncbi:hypothetical protein [Roseiconus nitratireducens]|uniref:hypothetical protein n=1 Tax=Roseiconus nitratireducens TaxID=2605748 RepID=UPI001F3BEEF0|nr:hypothetical protein [Roseiconus nitratireducens]
MMKIGRTIANSANAAPRRRRFRGRSIVAGLRSRGRGRVLVSRWLRDAPSGANALDDRALDANALDDSASGPEEQEIGVSVRRLSAIMIS